MFLRYVTRTINIEPATSCKIDTETIVLLPDNSKGYVTSKFRGGKIRKFKAQKQCMWVEILNKSYKDNLKFKKDSMIGFAVIKPEHLAHKHATRKTQKKKMKKDKISKKTSNARSKMQTTIWWFYAGRDVVKQAAKVAPGIIKAATNDINRIAEQRINQVISQGGQELECVLPKILRGAVEDVYQIPFRLLGEFGKKQFNNIKRKILK